MPGGSWEPTEDGQRKHALLLTGTSLANTDHPMSIVQSEEARGDPMGKMTPAIPGSNFSKD
ncbi:hypothetical protein GCM10010350_76950 [Streptomyces galilaeus]|nr:hypothetical protein GCM10010350_76950 [Streptomyces galilaeus]